MVTKSPVPRSATSSAAQPAKGDGGGLFKTSRYTLANTGRTETGCYGAIALSSFNTKVDGKMKDIKRGEIIPAKLVMTWPLANRLAMGTSARVRYFVTEAEADEAAREMEAV